LELRWVIDRVAPGKSGWIKYRADVQNDIAPGTQVNNRAWAVNTGDPTKFDGGETGVTASNVKFTVVCGPSSYLTPGDEETVKIKYESDCQDDVTDLVFSVKSGPGASYVDNSATGGGGYNPVTSVITWTVPSLPAGTFGEVLF
jgi:hypothetical protein